MSVVATLLHQLCSERSPDERLVRRSSKSVGGSDIRGWIPHVAPLMRATRYRVVGDREPYVVIHGVLDQMGAVLVRVGEDTRGDAEKLCGALRAAGTYCDVLPN